MRTFKLSAATVKTAMGKPTPRYVWDGEVKGFGLRVRPGASGTKGAYLFKYRVRGSRAVQWATLGATTEYTADEARTWARGQREIVNEGRDPGAVLPPDEKAPEPEDSIPTLDDYVERYLTRKASGEAHKAGRKMKESTLTVDRGNLERIVRDFSEIAAKRLHLITQADVETMVRRKKHPVSGNRRLALLRHLLNVASRDTAKFSLRTARVDSSGARWVNPCGDVGPTKERGRQPRPTPDVWPRLFKMLDKYSRQPTPEELKEAHRRAQLAEDDEDVESVSKSNPVIASLIKLQALTGARGSELRTARRSLITISETTSADGNVIRTGTLKVIDPKEGGEKVIPLSAEAVAVIDALPSIKGCDFVFPGRNLKDPIDITTVMHWWSRHRNEAGMENFRLHDLRHFVAGVLVKSGASITQIGQLFGHKSAQTTMRYAYLDDEAKTKLAATAANLITTMAQTSVEPGAGQ